MNCMNWRVVAGSLGVLMPSHQPYVRAMLSFPWVVTGFRCSLRKDWQAQLTALHATTGVSGVRFHGSFDDDMGPVVTKSASDPRLQ